MPETNQMVAIDVRVLTALVEKTPFKMHEFEHLIGWSFSMGDAPRDKRALAWAVLNLPKEDLSTLHLAQQYFPKLWIGGISDVGSVLVGSSNVVPFRRIEAA
jgi:hypothetical protein